MANDVHFQAYVLDGIVRWNRERPPGSTLHSFDQKLLLKENSLRSTVLHQSTQPAYHAPAAYTGELFGIDYLYSEIKSSVTLGSNIEIEIEEGLVDDDTLVAPDEESSLDPELDVAVTSFMETTLQVDSHDTQSDIDAENQFVDFKSIEGWDKVATLVALLVEIKGTSISTCDAENIVSSYEQLSPYDKKPISYGRVIRSPRGRFGRTKNAGGHVGVDAMKRCFVSAGCPSLPPSKSRVVEAICVHLFNTIASPQKAPNYISRYGQILQRYNQMKYAVSQSPVITEKTGLALFQINETTLSKWCGKIEMML